MIMIIDNDKNNADDDDNDDGHDCYGGCDYGDHIPPKFVTPLLDDYDDIRRGCGCNCRCLDDPLPPSSSRRCWL